METRRILIVEDEVNWQEKIRLSLVSAFSSENLPQPLIQDAQTYERARIALEREGPWDLLIADLTLAQQPESHELGKALGHDLIERAHAMRIPTIVVSGTTTGWDVRTLLLEQGVIDCIEKSLFSMLKKEFVRLVQSVLIHGSITYSNKNITPLSLEGLPTNTGKYYALLIGISDYSLTNPLRKAHLDAQSLYKTLLQSCYYKDNVHLLLDKDATKTAIEKELIWLSECAKSNDTALIFFAGHGLQVIRGNETKEYLCPVEADLDDLEPTCISSEEFTSALRSIKADRLAVFLDACHSGGIGETRNAINQFRGGFSEDTYNRIFENQGYEGKGRVIFASCKADEVSWELEELPNGLFTHYLLEGLRREAVRLDGAIPILRLGDYLSYKVTIRSSKKPKPQTPFFKLTGENFILAVSQQI